MFCFVHRCLKLPRFWSEVMNSVRFLHLWTTARRNSPYSNPFSQAKAKTVMGREDQRCLLCKSVINEVKPHIYPVCWCSTSPHNNRYGILDGRLI